MPYYDGEYYKDIKWAPVTFYRPDGDTEGKDIGWCMSNGFYEIETGLWSGDWYWKHHPEEAHKKKANKKKRSYSIDDDEIKEICRSRREDLRAELLDIIYDGVSPEYQIAQARKELAVLDGVPNDTECPVCHQVFASEKSLDKHLQTQTGKGHDRYREQVGIEFLSAQEIYEQSRKKRKTASAPGGNKTKKSKASNNNAKNTACSGPKHADIRSFFAPIKN